METDKKLMELLLDVYSPSGEESHGIAAVREWVKDNVPEAAETYSDKMGNIAFSIGQGPRKIMVSGHIDEICMRVKSITPEGFIIPSNGGGFDKKILPGQEVVVFGDSDNVEGVVQTAPIHVWTHMKDGTDKAWDFNEMRIDVGAESKEEVEKLGIHAGSVICPRHKSNVNFGKGKIFGNSLDDKAGVWISLNVLKELAKKQLFNKDEVTFVCAVCVGEETGLRGAKVASRNINPDISIDIDVTHANDYGLLSGEDATEIKLGKGFVVSYGPDKSVRLNKIIEQCASDMKISFQREATRAGGTNTDSIQLFSADCETTLVSLPLLAMHTPVETMSWPDLEGARDMLISVIGKL